MSYKLHLVTTLDLFSGDSLQNQCRPGDLACVPCAERLPSCVGRENGNNTFPGRDMSDTFVICWEGRTVSVETCPEGYFDPKQRKCRTEIGAGIYRFRCIRNFISSRFTDIPFRIYSEFILLSISYFL